MVQTELEMAVVVCCAANILTMCSSCCRLVNQAGTCEGDSVWCIERFLSLLTYHTHNTEIKLSVLIEVVTAGIFLAQLEVYGAHKRHKISFRLKMVCALYV